LYGIDTNILLYAYDRSSTLFEQAIKFIARSCEEAQIALADLSLLEFYSVITDGRKISDPLSPSEAADIIHDIQSADEFHVFCSNVSIINKTISYARENNISRFGINDIFIAQTLAHYGIDKIYTLNTKDFKKFDFIEAINPFLPSAMPSAPCALRTIPYGKQSIDERDVASVSSVLRSKWLTQGPNTAEFESALCNIVSTGYAVAVNSGTSALHIACLAAGVKDGDEVITSPITFVASANCAVYCGGKPIFADIDPKTYNISPREIEKRITDKTKAVIPVHFAGQSCDMEVIQQIVSDAEIKYGHKIFIIEDACHALGSKYKGNEVGSCVFSDMTVMSFHPVKHITTGEGGVVLTNNDKLSKKLRMFRSHGTTSEPEEFISKDLAFPSNNSQLTTPNSPPNPWYYEQQVIGYNYRITNIQCALGLSQIKKLEKFRKRRKEIVNQYNSVFKDLEFLQIPFEDQNCNSNFHLYVLLFDFEGIGIDRASFMALLREKGFYTQVHYIPVHLQHYYRKNFRTDWGDYPNAEAYYKKCLSIPLFPAMTDIDIENVIVAVHKVLEA